MSEIKDGGSAFPLPVTISPAGDEHIAYQGMTLRDYLAVNCEADLGNYSHAFAEKFMGRPAPDWVNAVENFKFWAEFRAKLRYLEAEAMLAERAK